MVPTVLLLCSGGARQLLFNTPPGSVRAHTHCTAQRLPQHTHASAWLHSSTRTQHLPLHVPRALHMCVQGQDSHAQPCCPGCVPGAGGAFSISRTPCCGSLCVSVLGNGWVPVCQDTALLHCALLNPGSRNEPVDHPGSD